MSRGPLGVAVTTVLHRLSVPRDWKPFNFIKSSYFLRGGVARTKGQTFPILSEAYKIIERLVSRRLVAYLNKHNLLPTLQSAYRRFHSTETSVLKLVCDALLAADRGEVTLSGFLDLSACSF